jgi:hypothetical protein
MTDLIISALLGLTLAVVLFANGCICQVAKLIFQIRLVVVLCGKSQVRLGVHPNLERLNRGYQDPYSDVKLLTKDNHGCLNVLLSYPN